MKRWLVAVLLVVCGCSNSSTFEFAELSGVFDVARVGELVFVTSADRSELRVLETRTNVTQVRSGAGFVRGPNPLEYLSIPVVDRPVSLMADRRFPLGQTEPYELTGPYVYVRGAGSREVSIVNGDRSALIEVARLPASGPVTALAPEGAAQAGGDSVLYFAEDQGGTAAIFRVVVPAPDRLATASLTPLRLLAPGSTPAAPRPLAFVGETVVAMVVVPTDAPGQTWLAVATRSAQGRSGTTSLLKLETDATSGLTTVAQSVPLEFSGPIRLLRTHGRVNANADTSEEFNAGNPGAVVLAAGTHVLGVLDEEACQGAFPCGGVESVDVHRPPTVPEAEFHEGQRSRDYLGLPMLPYRLEDTLVNGLELVPHLRTNYSTTGLEIALAAVLTASNGYLYVFAADIYNPLDVKRPILNATATEIERFEPIPANFVADSFALLDPNGIVFTPVEGTTPTLDSVLPPEYRITGADGLPHVFTRFVNDGVVRDETLSITYQGVVSGLSGYSLLPDAPRRGTLSGGTLTLVPGLTGADVRPGDIVDLLPNDTCPLDLRVQAVDLAAGTLQVSGISTADGSTTPVPEPLPSGCAGFAVRAATDKVWVVSGTVSGYLGRINAGDVFTSRPGPVRFRPENGVDPSKPMYEFQFTPPDFSAVGLATDDHFVVNVDDNYEPLRGKALTATGSTASLPAYYLPAGITYMPPWTEAPRGLLYVAYPSANGILQVDPKGIILGEFLQDVGNFE